MNLITFLLVLLVISSSAFPLNWVQSVAENIRFESYDNYLPKVGDWPKFEYTTDTKSQINTIDIDSKNISDHSGSDEKIAKEKEKITSEAKTWPHVIDIVKEGAVAGIELLMDDIKELLPSKKPKETATLFIEEIFESTTNSNDETGTTDFSSSKIGKYELDPFEENTEKTVANRPPRQGDEENEVDANVPQTDNNAGANGSGNESPEKQSEEESSEEEEDGNMLTGLISAFIGGLSKPDGSVDVEAITGLLGSLSSQREDGSYDFNGLTELLKGFFGGGGEDGGGGSDFGGFIGGLLGAFIKGVAKPPGPRGAGIFTGNLLTAVLPALSGPEPTEEGEGTEPPQGLDSGGFLGGLLSSIGGMSSSLFGSSSGSSSGSGGDGDQGGGSKFSIIKAIFSFITSIFTSSSGSH